MIRQDIIDAVLTRMQTIATPTYRTNVGSSFFKYRAIGFTTPELPAGNVLDTIDEVMGVALGGTITRERRKLTVEIRLFAENTAPDDSIRELIYDVYQAIGTDDTFGVTGVSHTTPVSDALYVVQDGVKVADAVVIIEVSYVKTLWADG